MLGPFFMHATFWKLHAARTNQSADLYNHKYHKIIWLNIWTVRRLTFSGSPGTFRLHFFAALPEN